MFKDGNKGFSITIIVILVLSLGTLVAFLAMAPSPDAEREAAPPLNVTGDRINVDNLAVSIGNPDAPVELTIYEDFGCPACQELENENEDKLREYIEGEDVKVSYKVVSIMDNSYGDNYPSRAANFMLSVSQHAPEQWHHIHDMLYNALPQSAVNDEYFFTLAQEAGVEDEALDTIKTEVKDGFYDDVVTEATRRAVDEDGIQGTPSVWVNGEEVGSADFESAVQSALEE